MRKPQCTLTTGLLEDPRDQKIETLEGGIGARSPANHQDGARVVGDARHAAGCHVMPDMGRTMGLGTARDADRS
jgi:hypothetical protein